jgi:hypothetical protein
MTPSFLTPEMLAAAYDLLELTPPFNAWNLPPSESLRFEVFQSKEVAGDYTDKCIRVSSHHIGTVRSLVMLVAHEMVHLHLDLLGVKDWRRHGRAFKKLAAEVCKHHLFDPRQF